MRAWLALAVLCMVLPLTSGCGYIVYTSGPYRGKVVDAETKAPIEGAVVLAVWYKTVYKILHGGTAYHAAAETLTDANGEFTMGWSLGLSLNPFTWMREPEFLIFKPGYGHYPRYQISPLRNLDQAFRGERTVVELPKLKTREERLENLSGIIVIGGPEGDYPQFLKLYNEESQSLGLQPVRRF